MNHPLPIGTLIRSVRGEMDHNEDGTRRKSGPNAVGRVISADYYPPHQGWTYGIQFPDNGPWVFIDQSDSIDDPTKYQLVESDQEPIIKWPERLIAVGDTTQRSLEIALLILRQFNGTGLYFKYKSGFEWDDTEYDQMISDLEALSGK